MLNMARRPFLISFTCDTHQSPPESFGSTMSKKVHDQKPRSATIRHVSCYYDKLPRTEARVSLTLICTRQAWRDTCHIDGMIQGRVRSHLQRSDCRDLSLPRICILALHV